MRPSEIREGSTYACKGGWYRRVVTIREAVGARGPYREVKYESGRDTINLSPQAGWCHIDWFAGKCLRIANG